jgi:hypothetical protein
MTQAVIRWAGRLGSRLGRLADSPLSLLAVLLLANALVRPYGGFAHDARLYAVQVAERLQPGSYGEDLFLRYGSQDSYSAFTRLLAPLVSLLGLGPAFFLVYLASKALFFWGVLRLTLALVPDRPAAVLALLFVAVAPLPLGGNEIFHLNESFLTPRIAACGLVLLGLERMLAGRPRVALLGLAGGMLLHPLMAVGGLFVFLAWWLAQRLTPRQLAVLAAVLGVLAAAALAYRPLGTRLFGSMDDEWRDIHLEICFYIDPAWWAARDWARLGAELLVCGAAAFTYARPCRRFVLAVLAVGLLGLLGSALAVRTPYLLLIQTSPYRALWLAELLAVPLGFWGAAHLWRRGPGLAGAAAPGLVLLLTCRWGGPLVSSLVVWLALFPIFLVAWRGLGARPRRPDWLRWAAAADFAITALLLLALDALGTVQVCRLRPDFRLDIHPLQVVRAAPGVIDLLSVLGLVLLGAAGLAAGLGTGVRLRRTCLALWLAYQAGLAWAYDAPWYARRFSARHAPREFVASFLRDHAGPGARRPTVYWPTDLRDIWLVGGARSYFNTVQMSGSSFNRGTALEGKRRALLVRRFELSQMVPYPPPPPWWREALERFFRAEEIDPIPTEDDLWRLCQEEGLDFVILEAPLGGLPCATDGRYYIYDCRRLRALASLRP